MLIRTKKAYKRLKVIKPNKKIHDYGLGILKTFLAVLVIAAHQFSRNTTKNEIILKIYDNRNIHVPSFFIMSFYFTCHNLLSQNPKKILSRFVRLLIPYIGWPIIIKQTNRIYNQKYKTKFPDSIEILKSQLFWGHEYLSQFWFQWDLIVTTLLFLLIILIFRKNCLFILILILILFYYCQYSGNYFQKYLPIQKNNKYTILRMFEMVPLGVTGFIIGYFNIINKINKYKFQTLVISCITYHIVNNYQLFRIVKLLYIQELN